MQSHFLPAIVLCAGCGLASPVSLGATLPRARVLFPKTCVEVSMSECADEQTASTENPDSPSPGAIFFTRLLYFGEYQVDHHLAMAN